MNEQQRAERLIKQKREPYLEVGDPFPPEYEVGPFPAGDDCWGCEKCRRVAMIMDSISGTLHCCSCFEHYELEGGHE